MQRLRHLMVGFAVACGFMAVAAHAQNISIVSGNGQFLCPTCVPPITFPITLQVKVTDANGNALPNSPVNWALTNTGGSAYATLTSTQTFSDTTGTATNYFNMPVPFATPATTQYLQATILASTASGSASVVFTETMILTNPANAAQLVTWRLNSPVQGQSLSGQIGQQLSAPLQAQVMTGTGFGVPNVEVRVSPCTPDNSGGCPIAAQAQGPTVQCASVAAGQAPTSTFTDGNGQASCNLVITGTPGNSQVAVTIGGIEVTWFNLSAQAGPPAAIRIISGNNQSGNPGSLLPLPLLAEVDDQAGNPISTGVAVQWDVPAGSATLGNTRTTSDSSGRVSTNATLGNSSGSVQIRVRLSGNLNIGATFNENVNIVISGVSLVSGNSQVTPLNAPFPNPLIVQVVSANGQPVQGVAVNWAVTSGNATLSSTSTSTNSSGQASVNVSAGFTAGTVNVTATVAGQSPIVFTLTVRPAGPSITSSSFVNAAGFAQAPALSPCSLATVTGAGIAAGLQGSVAFANLVGPWSYQVANVTITVAGTMAPIYAVSNTSGVESATFQVPCETPVGNQTVTVNVLGGSATVTVAVQAVSPGIFQATFNAQGQVVTGSGTTIGVMQRPDGSFVSPTNPARSGEIIRMYCTGLGQTTPQINTNQYGISAQDMLAVNSIVVGVNNGGVPVVDTKYAPNMIGIWEVDFQIPSGTPSGNLPLAVAVVQGDNLLFGNPSLIPVQQ